MPVKPRSRTNCCPRTVNARKRKSVRRVVSVRSTAAFFFSFSSLFLLFFIVVCPRHATLRCGKSQSSELGQSRNESVISESASPRARQEMTRRSWRKVVLKTKTQVRVQTRQKLDYTHPLFLLVLFFSLPSLSRMCARFSFLSLFFLVVFLSSVRRTLRSND